MFSKMKTAERELARTIRRGEGAPIKEIACRVGVAPSSVCASSFGTIQEYAGFEREAWLE
jgi:hypothetical protein